MDSDYLPFTVVVKRQIDSTTYGRTAGAFDVYVKNVRSGRIQLFTNIRPADITRVIESVVFYNPVEVDFLPD